jgi:hypothetical protein
VDWGYLLGHIGNGSFQPLPGFRPSGSSAPITGVGPEFHLQVRLRHIAVNPRARILKLEQVQLSKVFLLYPTAQLQECGCFTHNFRCAAFLARGK